MRINVPNRPHNNNTMILPTPKKKKIHLRSRSNSNIDSNLSDYD